MFATSEKSGVVIASLPRLTPAPKLFHVEEDLRLQALRQVPRVVLHVALVVGVGQVVPLGRALTEAAIWATVAVLGIVRAVRRRVAGTIPPPG